MVIPNIKSLLNRVVTRDLPLFMVSASYGKHLRRDTEPGLSFSLSKSYVLMDQGTAFIYRDNDEWYKQLPGNLEIAVNDPRGFKYIQEAIDKTGASTRYFEAFLHRPPSNPSIRTLEEFRHTIQKGVPGMIFAHWIPLFSEQKLAEYGKGKIAYFEDSRKKIEKFFSLAASSAYLLLEVLTKKYGLKPTVLKYAAHAELLLLLGSGSVDLANIESRKNARLLFIEDKLLIGDEAIERFLDQEGYVLEQPPRTNVKTLAGTTACRGIVRREIQIIMSRDEFSKFIPGKILVAPMTSPEYTPLIYKASGIITNEGGLLSHAAIVSRELRKPCLVGTKFATDILKDFQLVELNATEGYASLV